MVYIWDNPIGFCLALFVQHFERQICEVFTHERPVVVTDWVIYELMELVHAEEAVAAAGALPSLYLWSFVALCTSTVRMDCNSVVICIFTFEERRSQRQIDCSRGCFLVLRRIFNLLRETALQKKKVPPQTFYQETWKECLKVLFLPWRIKYEFPAYSYESKNVSIN